MTIRDNEWAARVRSIHTQAKDCEHAMVALCAFASGSPRLSTEYLRRVADTRLYLQNLEGLLGDLLADDARPIAARIGEGGPA